MSMRHAIVFLRDARAATALEYGLIVTGIALGTLAVLAGIGAKLTAAFLLLKDAVWRQREDLLLCGFPQTSSLPQFRCKSRRT
jgi:Flp pilus assembly pilin Flp